MLNSAPCFPEKKLDFNPKSASHSDWILGMSIFLRWSLANHLIISSIPVSPLHTRPAFGKISKEIFKNPRHVARNGEVRRTTRSCAFGASWWATQNGSLQSHNTSDGIITQCFSPNWLFIGWTTWLKLHFQSTTASLFFKFSIVASVHNRCTRETDIRSPWGGGGEVVRTRPSQPPLYGPESIQMLDISNVHLFHPKYWSQVT